VTTLFVTHDQEEALEVSDELVVINAGRVEQVGGPNDLYDRPANEFVMEFLGPVTRLNGLMVRPHDIDVFTSGQPGTTHAQIERLQRVGFEVRANLRSDDSLFWVQLTPGQVETLEITEGSTVWVRPARGAATITTGSGSTAGTTASGSTTEASDPDPAGSPSATARDSAVAAR